MALVDTISSGGRKVKIYSVTNRGNDFLKLSYHWAGQWKQRLLRRQGPQDDQRARAAARYLARAMAAGLEGQVQDFTKGIRIFRAAEEALYATGMPVDIACREYAMAHEVLNGKAGIVEAAEFFIRSKSEVKERVLLRDAVEQFIEAQKADGASEKYLQDIRSRMRRFANENEGYLHEINADQIQKWLRGLGVAPRTRNNFLSLIKTFSHWAKDAKLLPKTAPTEADELALLPAPCEVRIHDPETVAAMLFGAAEHEPSVVPYLALGYFAGVRPKEMERMTGSSIRFDHNDVEVRAWQAKQTRRKSHRRLTPMQPNLIAWLSQFPVGPHQRIANAGTRNLVVALRRKLKIDWSHDVMRHSAISNLVALTGNVDQVALWCGNSRQVIYSSYLNQVTKREAETFFSVAPEVSGKIVKMA